MVRLGEAAAAAAVRPTGEISSRIVICSDVTSCVRELGSYQQPPCENCKQTQVIIGRREKKAIKVNNGCY